MSDRLAHAWVDDGCISDELTNGWMSDGLTNG